MAMAGRVPDEIRLRRARGAQLPDWFDRLTDAHAEVRRDLADAAEHAGSAAILDIARLNRLVADWPRSAPSDDLGAMYRVALPRALAVSRYLRWLAGWQADRVRSHPVAARVSHAGGLSP
jgi:hypothetical protein